MMTTMAELPAAKAPWHLWVVGVASLLWNAFGGYDYTMSHASGEPYYRQMQMTDAQIVYLNAMPTWMHGFWAIGVWGSVAGSILLLLRRKWAFPAFAISFIGAAMNVVYTYVLTNGAAVYGAGGAAFTLVIAGVCVLLVWYSRTMAKRGVLR
jgi:hypothetical protein